MKTHGIEISSMPTWAEPTSGDDEFLHSRRDFENSGVTTPAVNIIETREDLRIEMVAPGMKKEAFNITVEAGVLSISYDHDDNRAAEGRNWKYRLREYNYHSFMRNFLLPHTVKPENIVANYSDGILSLRIQKKDEAIARRIEVK